MTTDNLLTLRDAARLLHRSTKSLRNYVKEGRLAAEKIPGPKGPQFVFRTAEIERFAAEVLQLETAGKVFGDDPVIASAGKLPPNLPALPQNLMEALIVLERDRTELISRLAEEKAEAAHTIGSLEERVHQLEKQAKKEAAEVERWQQNFEVRDNDARMLLRSLETHERKHWWQIWRPTFDIEGRDDE